MRHGTRNAHDHRRPRGGDLPVLPGHLGPNSTGPARQQSMDWPQGATVDLKGESR